LCPLFPILQASERKLLEGCSHACVLMKLRIFKILAWLPKKLKYLGINSMKQVTDLYNENYKSLKKEINKDIR
jgi:hypothetical protein